MNVSTSHRFSKHQTSPNLNNIAPRGSGGLKQEVCVTSLIVPSLEKILESERREEMLNPVVVIVNRMWNNASFSPSFLPSFVETNHRIQPVRNTEFMHPCVDFCKRETLINLFPVNA